MAWLALSDAMLSKNTRPYDPSLLATEQRLLANVRDLFASNTLSANRAQELINDVASASPGLRSFAKMKRSRKANISRTLKKNF